MKYIRDLSGNQVPQITEVPIATGTNIAQGAYCSLSAGLTIAAVNNLSTKVAGVTEQTHTGTNGTLTSWNAATTVRMYTSPTAVFAYTAPTITATANTASNLVEASGLADFAAANAMQGGYLELKTINSTTSDSVGTRKLVTASVNATKQFTVAFTNVGVGDTFYCYPPMGFYKGEFNSTGTEMVLTATTNGPLAVVGWDFEKKEVHVMARYHQYGNQDA